jgi:hypothetical protein
LAPSRRQTAEFEPDHAAADDHEMPGHLAQRQRARAVDDQAFGIVDLDAGQRGDRGARGDDDVLGGHALARDLDRARVLERGEALEPVDLVLLEQEFDAAGQPFDRRVLLAEQHGQVELDLARLHAELGQRAVRGFLEQLGAVQQRLGGNAADVEAGAAQRLAAFGAGGLEPELRRADRRDIAAGTRADDEDVVVVFSHDISVGGAAAYSCMENC